MSGADRSVIVIGAGPVGLALANDLGQRGVPCVVVEKHRAHSPLPKMNHVNVRSMELCRRWGLADEVRKAGWPEDHPMDVAYVTRLGGHEIARFRFPSHRDRPAPAYTPEPSQRCPQIWFDPILEAALARYPHVEVRRGVELDSFEDTGERVTARLRAESGQTGTLTAEYLVGADGAGSRVREIAGIERESWGPSPWQLAISLRARNFGEVEPRRAAFYFVLGERGTLAVVTPTDGEELWRLNWNVAPGQTPADVDPATAVEALAGPDLDYELVDVMAWQIRFTLAERYRQGRVFLAGDAARTLSPTGGLGMNTGLADAADLGWKLAARTGGWGGDRLLDSYDAERRAVGRAINEESLRNLVRVASIPALTGITSDGPEGDRVRAEVGRVLEGGDFRLEWSNEGAVLGARYDTSPVIPPTEGSPPAYDPNHYEPASWPGRRAPHAWLSDGRSTLDLFGRGLTLLRIGASAPAVGSLEHEARAAGVPLEVIELDETASGERLLDLYASPLVLVRPDGIVAWCGTSPPGSPRALLDTVRGA